MATEIDSSFSPKLGESSRLVEHADESYGVVDSDDEAPLMSAKNRKCVEKLLERTIFVSVESYLENLSVNYLFLNDKIWRRNLQCSPS